MTTFDDVSKQVHLIDDLILNEMISGKTDYNDRIEFSKHILATKYWFARISWTNKKQFLLLLLHDITSVWTLSLLLKSIWNCKPKDAVSSISEKENIWSSYDQVPLDNNRTAIPDAVLSEVTSNDRIWFSTLDSDEQALVISELLTISGGPIMWEILAIAQQIYETNREQQIQETLDYVIVSEPPTEKNKSVGNESKRETPRRKMSLNTSSQTPLPGQAERELEINLATWNSALKSIRDSFKLEELEMTYKDGSKRTIWKVNRQKPDNMETVDFVQLLPSVIAKRILMYVPQNQYGEISRVNRYWAFLIDEIKAEMLVRQKINTDLERLREIILRHDQELGIQGGRELRSKLSKSDIDTSSKTYSVGLVGKSNKPIGHRHEVRRHSANTLKPIAKMSDLFERLDIRGAADENIWKWCNNILKLRQRMVGQEIKKEGEGIVPLWNLNFLCPLLGHSLKVPLEYPLIVDPTLKYPIKALENKRSSWRKKSVATQYSVTKLPSYLL